MWPCSKGRAINKNYADEIFVSKRVFVVVFMARELVYGPCPVLRSTDPPWTWPGIFHQEDEACPRFNRVDLLALARSRLAEKLFCIL